MSSEHSAEEQALLDQVEQSERTLHRLETDLRAVDAELDALAERDHRYRLLERVCESLEELEQTGSGGLFWGEAGGHEQQAERIRHARENIDEYCRQIAAVEDRRHAVVAKINEQNDTLDYLHYDLRDAIERAESERDQWVVEREEDGLPNREQVMPWARGCEEDQRFRKSLGTSLAASVAIALVVSTVAIPLATRDTANELPERVAKLVRQERTPPPPEPVEQRLPEPEELPEPDPEKPQEKPPEPTPEVTNEPQLAEVQQPDTREQVKSKGILAFRDSFADRANMRPTAQLGSQARVRNAGEDAVGRPQRMMVATTAPGSSGGINLADISRDVGGGGQAIEGVQLTRVASSIGTGSGPDRPLSGGAAAGRTDEEIQIVFDRYKAALYRLYNRELRKDPTLRGQLVLRLTIEPNGSVSMVALQSSDMNAPVLAEQVLERVRTFDFGAKEDIVAMTIIYPIDFLPAA